MPGRFARAEGPRSPHYSQERKKENKEEKQEKQEKQEKKKKKDEDDLEGGEEEGKRTDLSPPPLLFSSSVRSALPPYAKRARVIDRGAEGGGGGGGEEGEEGEEDQGGLEDGDGDFSIRVMKGEEERLDDEEEKDQKEEEEEEEEEEKRALEIEFTLPPGSYATMLVRELTRECTSVMHQRSLN